MNTCFAVICDGLLARNPNGVFFGLNLQLIFFYAWQFDNSDEIIALLKDVDEWVATLAADMVPVTPDGRPLPDIVSADAKPPVRVIVTV